jgi:FtsZ-interacting cell division protein ZipA
MSNLIQNILASKNEGWEQLIILLIVFGIAIIKKIFSSIKSYSENQSHQYEEEQEHETSAHPKHIYSKEDFKTIEQIRDERKAKIRQRYGIPKPTKPMPQAYSEPEPEPEPLEEQAIREHMFEAPPPPPVYVPPVHRPKKKPPVQMPQEVIQQHPAYAQPQTQTPLAEHGKKAKHEAKEVVDNRLIRLSSPQDLRAAILYQEILGKPLALRD